MLVANFCWILNLHPNRVEIFHFYTQIAQKINYFSPVLHLSQYISSMIDVKKGSHGLFFSWESYRFFPPFFCFLFLLLFLDLIKMLHSWKPWATFPSMQWLCISLHWEIFLLPGGGRTRWSPTCPSSHHFWDSAEHRQSQDQSLLHTTHH